MNKKLSLMGLSVLLAVGISQPAWAETVMEKVARTGILTVGTRIDLVPYSYVDDQGKLVGYSVDVVKLIRDQLQQELGKDITIQVVEEKDFPQRMAHLTSGEVDIACDTAFTWQRDQVVDFSVSYGLSGIRLLVPTGSSLGTPESLVGKRIGVLPHTVAESTIRAIQPQATIVPLSDVAGSLVALQQGKVDAIAGDTIILAGEIARTAPDNFALTPVATGVAARLLSIRHHDSRTNSPC
jgi:polar amino acid transport system substrate-binding protein